MSLSLRIRLSIMMFLQYFIWGAWFVTMGTYMLDSESGLAFELGHVGRAYNAAPVAAIISPFIVGLIADRFFATQWILGFLHLAGGAFMFWLSTLTQGTAFGMFWLVLMGHTLVYMPTLALTNSLSFRQMTDPSREFPPIRVLGTLGWIASSGLAGILIVTASGGITLDIPWLFGDVSGQSGERTSYPMKIAAISSIVMGLYCFSLPHTPPARREGKVSLREIVGWDALKMMKDAPFAVFVIGSFLICWPLQFYYAGANAFLNSFGGAGMEQLPPFENAATKQTLGQWSELVFMLIMPWFFVRLGVKKMLLFGMLAWVIRYVLFAYGDSTPSKVWMLYGGILLHGICYDFFFVTGQIYVDKKAPDHIRASAQGFITFVTIGLGLFIGSEIFAALGSGVQALDVAKRWYWIWIIPAAHAFVVLLLFAWAFRPRDADAPTDASTQP